LKSGTRMSYSLLESYCCYVVIDFRPVTRNVVWGRNGGAKGAYGVGSGKNFCIFSFKMVHFDAFWTLAHFTATVIVTMMFMTSTVRFLNCTCSTMQQKGRLRIFCADFSGGGFNPITLPPLNMGLVDFIISLKRTVLFMFRNLSSESMHMIVFFAV